MESGAIPCGICGGSATIPRFRPIDHEFGIPCESVLHGCEECGAHFLHPLPNLAETYPETYAPAQETGDTVRQSIFRAYHRFEARRLAKWLPAEARVLDVGCGDGGFLRAARELGKWKLEGIEFSEESAALAKGQGLDVVAQSLEQAELPPESYDFIRMSHTIEHLADPLEALVKLERALKVGGRLLGETPNVDCLDFRLLGRYWGGLHYPRHPWLFTRRALGIMAAKAGFEIEEIANCRRTVGWSRGVQNWIDDKLPIDRSADGWRPWYPVLIAGFLPVTMAQSWLGRTGVMEFLLRKASPTRRTQTPQEA